MKFVTQTVSVAPIHSSETSRIIYFNSKLKVDEIPENSRKVLRWVDEFEQIGLDFNTGEMTQPSTVDLKYDVGFNAYIEYHAGLNTGILTYPLLGQQNSLVLRRENYFLTVEYKEIYPPLKDLQDIPLDELISYYKYVSNKLDDQGGTN